MLTYLAGAAVVLAVLAFWARLGLRRRQRIERPRLSPQTYTDQPPATGQHVHLPVQEIAAMCPDSLSLNAQPAGWRDEMYTLGQRLVDAQVTSLLFVHGTFLGEDPFDILRLLRKLHPSAATMLDGTITDMVRRRQKSLFGTVGNFTPEYLHLLSEALDHDLQVTNFTWSSANHHVARLSGALRLLSQLARSQRTPRPPSRVMLIGHSHAGQLFSILSQMLACSERACELARHAEGVGFRQDQVLEDLGELRGLALDVVTFGTPPRYAWGESPRLRLLHVINHRGNTTRAGTLPGLMFTRDGDYVQQYGIAGSDILSPVKEDRTINERLDRILGVGCDLNYWKRSIKHRVRLHNFGFTYLVDYGDSSLYPNFFRTLLGHGCYTRPDVMLFNASLVINHFYPNGRRGVMDGTFGE